MNRILSLSVAAAAVLSAPALGQLELKQSNIGAPGAAVSGGSTSLVFAVGQPLASPVLLFDNGTTEGSAGFFFATAETPLFVELEYFTARYDTQQMGVSLEWATSTEIDNAGFHIYAAIESENGWVRSERLTQTLIAPMGSEFEGATYTYFDPRPIVAGETARAYFLEDVEFSGRRTMHGPAVVTLPGPSAKVTGWEFLGD